MSEVFHVIQLGEGTYFVGDSNRVASVGTPLKATRCDPERANLAELQAVFPDAKIVRVVATYQVEGA